MKFLSLNPEAFGLDISDLSLRAVKLKKRGKFFDLASWGEMEIEPGIIQRGEIQDEEKLVENIKQLLAKLKGERIKTKYVNASLPEEKAFLQVIKVPKMEQEELLTAVPFEAENYIPLPVEQVYLDFEIVSSISNESDQLDVLIAALPKKSIDPYVSCLKKADLMPKVLEVESQAIVRALVKKHISPFPLFIIDFGKSFTSFIVFSGYSLRFTSSIPVSSYKLTEAISQNLKVSLQQAEKLKIKYGLEKNKKIVKAITPLLIDLVQQAKKCIDYYHTHNGKIEKILLCGAGANLKGFVSFISSELKIPTELANPWVNILSDPLKKVPKIPFQQSLAYTTALGLAMRNVDEYD